MACIYCNNHYHYSNNCNVYLSSETRKQIIISKNLCKTCWLPLSNPQHCGLTTLYRCYFCFSSEHPPDSCPKKDSQMFLPRLDPELIQRFFKICALEEHYLIAFSTPQPLKFVKPLVVSDYIENLDFWNGHEECNFLFNGRIFFNGVGRFDILLPEKVINLLNLNSLIVKVKNISFYATSIFPIKAFLQLLTPFTKTLTCMLVQFDGKVALSDILQRCPNIEELELRNTNIEIENSWPHDLQKPEIANKLRDLDFGIKNFKFSVPILAKFLKVCFIPFLVLGSISLLFKQSRNFLDKNVSK